MRNLAACIIHFLRNRTRFTSNAFAMFVVVQQARRYQRIIDHTTNFQLMSSMRFSLHIVHVTTDGTKLHISIRWMLPAMNLVRIVVGKFAECWNTGRGARRVQVACVLLASELASIKLLGSLTIWTLWRTMAVAAFVPSVAVSDISMGGGAPVFTSHKGRLVGAALRPLQRNIVEIIMTLLGTYRAD